MYILYILYTNSFVIACEHSIVANMITEFLPITQALEEIHLFGLLQGFSFPAANSWFYLKSWRHVQEKDISSLAVLSQDMLKWPLLSFFHHLLWRQKPEEANLVSFQQLAQWKGQGKEVVNARLGKQGSWYTVHLHLLWEASCVQGVQAPLFRWVKLDGEAAQGTTAVSTE